MTLRELIRDVEARRRHITVRAPAEERELAETLAEHFATRNVTVEHVVVGPDETSEVLLTDDGLILARLCAGAARSLARPSTDAPWQPGFEACDYRDVLVHLDDTLFTSYDRRQMLATSREIEDRAWRTGEGTLHVGFQSFSALDAQLEVYRHLARTDLEIHIYGDPDCEPPAIEGVAFHPTSDPDVLETWFLAFDDGRGTNACALLAEERDPHQFFGFWTYDAALVDSAVEAIAGSTDRRTNA